MSAVVATTQSDAKVERVEASSLPADLKRVLSLRNATADVVVYKISTVKDESV